jgi:general secretion pathway protein H
MRRGGANNGFTLVEMLMVLAIIAVTLAMSLPYVRGSGAARILDATAQVLAARLRETHSAALFNNAERTFSIDLQHKLILNPVIVIPRNISIKITTAGQDITSEKASIRFFADGGSTGGIVTLSNGESMRRISVNWLSGAIVISETTLP